MTARALLPGGAEVQQRGERIYLRDAGGASYFAVRVGADELLVGAGSEGCVLRVTTRDASGRSRKYRVRMPRRVA